MTPIRTAPVRLLLAAVIAALLSLWIGSQHQAYAANFIVDSTADAIDASPGDGICDDGAGRCTLRAAIQETNALPGADTITLPPGTYTLSVEGPGESLAATGDLDITDDLTISGAGAEITIIDGNHIDQVLEVSDAVTAQVSDVKLQNGESDSFAFNGGGIENRGDLTLTDSIVTGNSVVNVGGGILNVGTLTMANVTVKNNTSGMDAGGIYNLGSAVLTDVLVNGNEAAGFAGGILNEGSLTISDSMVIGNASSLGLGGGLFNAGTSGQLTIVNTTISGNNADAAGGGIYNYAGIIEITNTSITGNTAEGGAGIDNVSGGRLTISKSTISGNTAHGTTAVIIGGGIQNFDNSTLTLIDSAVSGNTATHVGGGIANIDSTMEISNSTISGNTAGADGGGIFDWGISSGGELTLTNSTVSGNTATNFGGGIEHFGFGTLRLINSTVSGNNATTYGGGGIANFDSTMEISNSTISGNSTGGDGGGIFNWETGTAALTNTIVANSTDGGDCFGAITSNGSNIDSDGTCSLAAAGDISSTDPLLGPLADNGGPTDTHALLVGSPAIDAGSDDCPPPATDQRGVERPVDGDDNPGAVCDIGAFEYCPADADCDGFLDSVDACPTTRTVWATPIGDEDCDGFTTAVENFMGTLPQAACAATNTANDEDPDSLPMDFDDDQDTDVIDVLFFKPHILKSDPDPDYSVRFDFDVDGDVDIIDVLFLKSRINTSCAV